VRPPGLRSFAEGGSANSHGEYRDDDDAIEMHGGEGKDHFSAPPWAWKPAFARGAGGGLCCVPKEYVGGVCNESLSEPQLSLWLSMSMLSPPSVSPTVILLGRPGAYVGRRMFIVPQARCAAPLVGVPSADQRPWGAMDSCAALFISSEPISDIENGKKTQSSRWRSEINKLATHRNEM
jgi:hypothetical protein